MQTRAKAAAQNAYTADRSLFQGQEFTAERQNLPSAQRFTTSKRQNSPSALRLPDGPSGSNRPSSYLSPPAAAAAAPRGARFISTPRSSKDSGDIHSPSLTTIKSHSQTLPISNNKMCSEQKQSSKYILSQVWRSNRRAGYIRRNFHTAPQSSSNFSKVNTHFTAVSPPTFPSDKSYYYYASAFSKPDRRHPSNDFLSSAAH